MNTHYPFGMQKIPLLHILSYLEEKDIHSFALCEKKNYAFYQNNKTTIDFHPFLKKLAQDPSAWLYLKKITKDKPLLQKALIDFTDSGAILKKENGYPLLQELMNDYHQCIRMKKKHLDPNEKIIDLNCGDYYSFDKLKNGKVYFQVASKSMWIYDIKTTQITKLERISKNYTFLNKCKLDQANNRLYIGLYSSTVAISWDLATCKIFKKFKTPFLGARADVLMLDHPKLYVGYGNRCSENCKGKMIVFNTETGTILCSIKMNKIVDKIKKIEKYILVLFDTSDSINSGIKIFEDQTFTCIRKIKLGKGFFGHKPINGNYLTVRCNKINFIYDISDINNIKEIGSITIHNFSSMDNIKSIGNHFFIFDRLNGKATVGNMYKRNDENSAPIKFVQRIEHPQKFLYGGYDIIFGNGETYIIDYL